jgi:hypothetical protein
MSRDIESRSFEPEEISDENVRRLVEIHNELAETLREGSDRINALRQRLPAETETKGVAMKRGELKGILKTLVAFRPTLESMVDENLSGQTWEDFLLPVDESVSE